MTKFMTGRQSVKCLLRDQIWQDISSKLSARVWTVYTQSHMRSLGIITIFLALSQVNIIIAKSLFFMNKFYNMYKNILNLT